MRLPAGLHSRCSSRSWPGAVRPWAGRGGISGSVVAQGMTFFIFYFFYFFFLHNVFPCGRRWGLISGDGDQIISTPVGMCTLCRRLRASCRPCSGRGFPGLGPSSPVCVASVLPRPVSRLAAFSFPDRHDAPDFYRKSGMHLATWGVPVALPLRPHAIPLPRRSPCSYCCLPPTREAGLERGNHTHTHPALFVLVLLLFCCSRVLRIGHALQGEITTGERDYGSSPRPYQASGDRLGGTITLPSFHVPTSKRDAKDLPGDPDLILHPHRRATGSTNRQLHLYPPATLPCPRTALGLGPLPSHQRCL